MQINDSIFLGSALPEMPDDTLVIQQNKRLLFLSLLGNLIEIIVRGTSPLSLPNAIADSLEYLKAFGGTEQNGTPTPDTPMDIVSNNGVLKARHQSGLPWGYTLLDYIESTGTQFLQGNISGLTDNAEIEIDVYSYNYTADGGFFGLYNSSTTVRSFYTGYGFQNSIYVASYPTEGFKVAVGTAVAGNHTIERKGNGDIYVDGSKITRVQQTTTLESFTNTTSFIVGKSSLSGASLPARYKRITIKDKLDLIPARRNSDNVLGMYDLVSGQFFTNAGTGTFTAGDPVSDPVEIYTDGTVETINVYGKNLFDKNHLPERIYAYFANSGTTWTYASSGYSLRFPCLPNTTYTARYNGNSTQVVLSFASTSNDNIPTSDQATVTVTQAIRQNTPTINTPITLTTGANDKWLIVTYNAADPQNTDMANNLQIEFGSTATTYEPYFNGGTAVAEMLLKVGTYTDQQEIIDGTVTRKVGIKVLDGTEEYTYSEPNTYGIANITSTITGKVDGNTILLICSHFVPQTTSWSLTQTEGVLNGNSNNQVFFRVLGTRIPNLTAWTQWLADQYNAGTPVIIVYPLATETTESVAGQTMQVQQGNNVVEITQAAIDALEIEAKYKKVA